MPLLDIDKLLEFAVRLEDKGQKFYLEWASRVDMNNVRAFFEMIAEEETLHKKTFQELRAAMKSDPPGVEPQEEYEDYFRTFADYIVFSDTEMKAVKELGTAIEMAKKQELDAILFYSDLRKFLAEKHQDILKRIMDEERKHFVKLDGLQKKLNNS